MDTSFKSGVKMPCKLKIKLKKLSIPLFMLGTSLFIVLTCKTSFSGSHNISNICSIGVWFVISLLDGNSCVVYFRISWLFDFTSCITSTITLIAYSNEGNESR